MTQPTLGPFQLDRVIGRGGMGEVWSARHTSSAHPIAIKFDLHDPSPQVRSTFFREVQLVASLDSLNCVQVFDAGIVDTQQADLIEGVRPGAPWLAMELALGGSLSRACGPRTWAQLRHILVGLLEGLRHAHARGVLHRDIKYGNILLAQPRGNLTTVPGSLLDARVLLSDFGIGCLLDRAEHADIDAAGTPRYMAPEQIRGNLREQGPATDLYAVGVLAWHMACRRFPFEHTQGFQLLRAHLHDSPGRFKSIVPVPPGFEQICRQLLEKRPEARFPFAVNVLHAIYALGSAPGTAQPTDNDGSDLAATSRRSHRTPATAIDRGTLGLWGLKPMPLLGREREQRFFQRQVMRVVDNGKTEVVWIRGAAGIGKSHLLKWLREWVSVEGLADCLIATHKSRRDKEDGLVAMVARHYRLYQMKEDELAARIERALRPSPYNGDLGRLVEGQALPRDRRLAALAHALLSGRRTPTRVVIVEDVQWGLRTLVDLDRLLTDLQDTPTLFVLTARSEALGDRPMEQDLLNQLAQERSFHQLELGPLSTSATRSLCRTHLGLSGDLAGTVEQRTAGNPSFAIQWVDHWIEQHILTRGDHGLELRTPDVPLPTALFDVWTDRLDALLNPQPHHRRAVELAAVLGHRIHLDSWRAACLQLGLKVDPTLVDVLLQRRIWAMDSDGLHFAHGLAVEALLHAAQAGPHWSNLNQAAAESGGLVEPRRLAHLWLQTGRPERAIDPLRRACEAQLKQDDASSAEAFDLLESVLAEVDPQQLQPSWVHHWVLRSWAARKRGDLDEAAAIANHAVERSQHGALAVVHFEALKELGLVTLAQGHFDDALDQLSAAGNQALDAGRVEFASYCLLQQGDALMYLGRSDEADEIYAEIEDVFEHTHASMLSHQPCLGRAHAAIRAGRWLEAQPHLDKAARRAKREHLPNALAHIANLRGEVARYSGDLEAAAEWYADAADRYQELQNAAYVWPSLNRCLVRFGMQQHAEVVAQVGVLVDRIAGTNPIAEGCARFVRYASSCALADWMTVAREHVWLLSFLERVKLSEPDLIVLARAGVQHCRDHGEDTHEIGALDLLIGQLNRARGDDSELLQARRRRALLKRGRS